MRDFLVGLKSMVCAPATGALKDTPDERDRKVSVPFTSAWSVNLENCGGDKFPYVDFLGSAGQGVLPSCAGWAVSYAVALETWRASVRVGIPMTVVPGPCDLWSFGRMIEGDPDTSGVSLRNVFKGISRNGGLYHNPGARRTVSAPQPPVMARRFRLPGYRRILSERPSSIVRAVIANNLQPVIGAFSIYADTMRTAGHSGRLPLPDADSSPLGGHAMTIYGFDGNDFLVRNSWGRDWGNAGTLRMSSEYVDDMFLTWDLWTFDPRSI